MTSPTKKIVQELDSARLPKGCGELGAVACMEAYDDATAMITVDNQIVFANRAAKLLLGIRTPLPLDVTDLEIDADWKEQLTRHVGLAAQSQKLVSLESEREFSGNRQFLLEKFSPPTAVGDDCPILWCCRDVTTQKVYEAQLEAERKILEAILGGSSLFKMLSSICSAVERQHQKAHCAIQLEETTQERLHLSIEEPNQPKLAAPFIATSGRCSCIFAHFGIKASNTNLEGECSDNPLLDQNTIRKTPIIDEHGKLLATLILVTEEHGDSQVGIRQAILSTARLTALALSRELQKAEMERRERLYSSLVENSLDLILLVNENLRLEYVSPSVERLLGYEQSEVLDRPILDFVFKSAKETVTEDLTNLFASGTARSLGDVEITTATGAVRTFEFIGEGLDSTVSSTPGVVLSGRDVTQKRHVEAEQKQLRHALYYAAQEWRTTFDGVPTPVIVLDTKRRIRRLNQAALSLFHLPFRDLIGRALSEFQSPLWDKAGELLATAASATQPASETVTDDQLGKSWEVILSPITDDLDGRHVLIARDITELLKLQESSRQAEKMSALGSLVAGVAHEVRNPLFAISGVVSSLAQVLGPRDDLNEHVDVLQAEVARLSKLMYALLDYGKPPALAPRQADLTASVDAAQRQVRNLVKESGVLIVSELSGRPPTFEFDFERVTSAIRNVLENAIQHSPRGGTISCMVSTRETAYCVTISDRGPGISDEDLPKLFEPFFTRRRGGTGLGLPIVKRIIEQHMGRLIVQSEPDNGTSITLEFPRSANVKS